MKRYMYCYMGCKREELVDEKFTRFICFSCREKIIERAVQEGLIDKIKRSEEFVSSNNLYSTTPCRNRLPGGRYCDAIPQRATEISAIGCMKCKIRITDTTLQEIIKEDEYTLLE